MRKSHSHLLACGVLILLGLGSHVSTTFSRAAAPRGVPALTLDELVSGELPLVDLTWTLDEKNPYWPAANYKPFHLTTIATLEENGVLSKAFYTPEHLGTHLDAPNHFERNQPSVDEMAATNLFSPGVVIDVTLQSEHDADYRLTVGDLIAWEDEHGRIPDGAVVFMHTGWGRHWTAYPRYKNQDAMGNMHFPGFSEEAARWLVAERKIHGIGIDTLSIDYGLSKDFIVHHVINGAGCYGLENVARLEQLPARDFYVIAAPVKVRSGTGGPARLFAVCRPEAAAQ